MAKDETKSEVIYRLRFSFRFRRKGRQNNRSVRPVSRPSPADLFLSLDYFERSAMAAWAASTDEPAVTFFRAAMACGFISLAL